ncbi:MAG TPA: carbonic anhydrase [Candidatus Binatia bacterium]|nr:carbonic anhydrase [Candidatus Binatia bacterium]
MARPTPAQALALLKEGNARFVAGTPRSEPFGSRVAELANGQSPFAIVLGCSDSRVPIETIFDQVPGNVFVVRVAGNFLNDDNLGSIELAVDVLRAQLIVVLGHGNCGAVTAALGYVRDGIAMHGHIQGIVSAIAPAVRAASDAPGDWLDNAIAENVRRNVRAMTERSTIIAAPVEAGDVQVIGGIYDVGTGRVAFS